MTCWKCGRELVEGQRFCNQCGADQTAAPAPEAPQLQWEQPQPQPEPQPQPHPQPQPQPQYQAQTPPPPPPGGQNPGGYGPAGGGPGGPAPGGTDLSILFKIFGFACVVVFGFFALRGLWNIVRMLGYIRYVGIPFLIGTAIGGMVGVMLNVLVCAVGLLIALRRKPENADGLLIALGGVLLIRLAITTLSWLVSSVSMGYFGGFLSTVGLSLLLTLLFLGGLFGITIAAGEPMPLAGKTTEELKAALAAVLGDVQSVAGDVGAKANAAAKNVQASAQARTAQNAQNAQNAPRTPGFGQNQQPYQGQQPGFGQNQQPYQGQQPGFGQNQQPYGQPGAPQGPYVGVGRLKTDRSLLMYILLGVITCGIYGLYFIYKLAQDINTVCDGDGKHTAGLLAFFLLTILTCGIYGIYWYYAVANRLAANAPRYGLAFQENGTTVLLWELFGALVCGIGPFIAFHIIIKNTNSLCMAYNRYNNL